MQTIICDVCKKKMDNPITNLSFFYYAEHGVCENCKDNFEAQIKPTIRNKDPFSYEWYEKFIGDSFGKAIQKGKA